MSIMVLDFPERLFPVAQRHLDKFPPAFQAYKKLLEEECGNVDTRLKGLEAVTGKQLFFIATGMVRLRPTTFFLFNEQH